jgi:hypothetical protein
VTDELTPEQQFNAEDPETLVPRLLIWGRSPEQVVAEVVQLGWRPEAARALVVRVLEDLRRFRESPESRAELFRECRRDVWRGLLLLGVSFVLLALALLTALAGLLAFYLLPLGAFGLGGYLLNRGWSRGSFYRRLEEWSNRPDPG